MSVEIKRLLDDGFNEAMNAVQLEHRKAIEEAQAEHEAELAPAKQRFQEAVKPFHDQYNLEVEAAVAAYKERIAPAVARMDSAMLSLSIAREAAHQTAVNAFEQAKSLLGQAHVQALETVKSE